MAEEGNESRYVCKLCNKKFPCGKSFGGHMRSHVVANSAEFEEKLEYFDMKREQFVSDSRFAESGNGQSGYILRENPKKSWRAARPPLQEEKVCKQCGKGFKSMKALCGHMACHSERERGGTSAKDDQYSWTSENQKVVLDSHSDTEAEERMVRIRTRSSSSKSRKCKKVAEDWPFVLGNNGSSSVSEIDGHEQEEMAVCLMMLSRDCGVKVGVNSVVESSDNNSVVVETKSSSMEVRKERVDRRVERYEEGKFGGDETAKMEDSDSGYFLDECAKGESEVSVDWNRRSGGFGEWKKSSQMNLKERKSCENELRKSRKGNVYDDDEDEIVDDDDVDDDEKCGGVESRKRKCGSGNHGFWNESARMVKNEDKKSKYECFNCKKTFKSYQALGGHRPCSKKTNAYGECGENSPDDAAYYRGGSAKFAESPSKKSKTKSPSEKKSKTKNRSNNNKPHVCPFCDRVFKNGQALGGHKRSHFLTGHDESSSRSLVEKPDDDIRDLLDLNLPAPEADEDEDGGHFFPW
ncbi:zinc finger protein ZAT9-like [Salvia divinorum]|uniref:Zinc finger protein ZAT9-like n=1 Tax=Salvia divinorum TaxID=28513 RepID=A0ABD1H4I4_SALDI